ncbi:MAG TPA: hypothetical protein DDZ96_14285 [Porphyromonadaceae bacterium]|nr:hypothetical protein [Porphyromonadaceae bacterium]HBL34960.1 hypothetical protein [Porphyromonadaceae bacterium]HBX45324.1 hypothetical protein [Porphyromonadaceae bacterium]
MKHISIYIIGSLFLFNACNSNQLKHDASGTFETTEIIVSALAAGQIIELNSGEGQTVAKDQYLGYIDTMQLHLQKRQLAAKIKAINARKPNIAQQIAAAKEQIAQAAREKKRVENLVKDGAATQKQLDDMDTQLKVLQRTLAAQTNQISTSTDGLSGESEVLEAQIAQVQDLIAKSRIISPMNGIILNKYKQVSEVAAQGTPLLKIADTRHLFLRAYIVAAQLENVTIGQKAIVYINDIGGKQNEYEGTVAWISDKAEFTPKTIQTQDERQHLVYAVKIAVDNTDGSIKTGMYGDVDFK